MRYRTDTWRAMDLFVFVVISIPSVLWAEKPQVADPRLLTLERLADASLWRAQSPSIAWHGDGDNSLEFEDSTEVEGARDLVRYDTATRERTVLVAARELIPDGAETPLEIDGVQFSGDGERLLIFTNSKKVWRRNTRGDYWVFDLGSRALERIGAQAEPSSLFFAKFSPDASRVAYVWRNDLYVESIGTHDVVRLTVDGSDEVINGMGDWANEEELDIRDGFRWSPDGRRIAFWRFDTSGVGRFVLANQTEGLYPVLKTFPYPKAGTTNSAVSIGVVAAGGGATVWMQEDDDPREHYIATLEWAGNSEQIMVQHLNRHQNELTVFLGDAETGRYHPLLVEVDAAWVDFVPDWRWLDDGTRLLWVSDRDGWRHVYSVSRDGQTTTLLTPGAFDVVSIEGFDMATGSLYFVASPGDPLNRYLFRAALDGSGLVERLTPSDSVGYHEYDIAPNGRWAVHKVSTFADPGIVDLIRLPEHTTHRSLADNEDLRQRVRALSHGDFRFFRLPVHPATETPEASEAPEASAVAVPADPTEMLVDAFEMRPPDFDPAREYPVLFHVYGEPWGQTVSNKWNGSRYLWHLMLTQQGYLVMSSDNRGTRSPRGRDFRKSLYKRLGELSSADQAAAARQIAEWPYVDGSRMGIYGHSGGGSMTLNMLFRYPGLYTMGMSLAPVPDQRYYDTIYQERYLGLPTEDPEVYALNSPITHARHLEDTLLIVHGTGDDNCHYQGTEALIDELVAHRKQFTVMPYPNRTHSLREGEGTPEHLRALMTRFVQEHLGEASEALVPAER